MKLCLYGIPGAVPGRSNLKDPRLDAAHKLVEADKKAYAQIDVVGDDGLIEADGIAATESSALDLVLQDIEFVETRLARNPPEAEKAVLKKMQGELEAGRCLSAAGFSEDDWKTVGGHSLMTSKPVFVASAELLAQPEALLLQAFAHAGWICFLTVGGKENRAWPIRQGISVWEAGGAIHTDIQKGFIRAEIIGFADFIAAGGETQAKRANKLRLEMKQYVIQDYDLVNFRFNKS